MIGRNIRYLLILIFVLFIAFGAWRTVVGTRQKQQRFESLQKEVRSLEAESERLKKEVAYRNGRDFIEAEARDKLKMVKEGEHLLVISDLPAVLGSEATPDATSSLPVWQQWRKVLLGW